MLKFLWAFASVMAVSFLRLQKLFPDFAMKQLGELLGLPEYHYYSTAILQDEQVDGYVKSGPLKAQPGTRFPHLWIDRDDRQISTLDLLGKDFVLFTGADNPLWQKAAAATAIPIYSLPGKEAALEIEATGAVLVRPDGFVAWRCEEQPPAPVTALKEVITKLLNAAG